MILVIDDVKTFPFPDDKEVYYARTLKDGNLFLDQFERNIYATSMNNESLDELWLDHDLGGDDTIRSICLMLAERAFNGNPYPVGRIVICSMNPVGIDWIWSTLSPYYDLVICNDPESVQDLLDSTQAKWY
jgi:hypothetical protein